MLATSHVDALGRTNSFQYTNGRLTRQVSPLGITNETIHDARRRPIQQVDSHGVTNATTYCECGSPSQVTAALGIAGIARTNSFDYDYQGRLWKTTLPAGTVLTNYYDLAGRLVVTQDPFGFATNVYDNLNRLTARYSAAGLVLSQTYDLGDRVMVQTDASGVTVTNSYDGLGRLKTLHRAGSTTPVLAYGYTFGLAPPTAETNAVGSVRTMHFDAGQRLNAEVQVGLWTNSFAYLPSGDLKHLDDGRGNRTEWKYDAFGRVMEKWYQGQTNADLVYSYDAVGRLTNRFSRTGNPGTNGYNTIYAYNRVGGLTNVTSPSYSGNVARAYGYDALGRLTNMVDAAGTTTYTYTLGTGGLEAMTEDGPWAADTVTVTNRHGLRSHLVVGQPNGTFATTYGWDAARRMTNVTAAGQGFGYTYLGAGGQIARLSLPGGSTITNTFDTLGRHTSTALWNAGGTNLNLHGYAYDASDRRIRISRTNAASTNWNGHVSFGYDAAGQLVSAQTTNAVGNEVTSERFGYAYDASQNLRWRTNHTTVTGFTNNVLNQLTALNATTRTHDRRGNLLSNVQTGETLLYSWDDESQLTSVRVDPPSSPAFQPWRIDFVYDGLRRLRRTQQFTWNGSAWTSQGEVRYLYDGMLIVQERNSSNTPQVHYSRGLDLSGTIHGAGGIGGLLMRSHGYSAGNWSSHNAYHSDANGNVTALVNSSGVLQASYRYNPYGGLISSSGALAAANTMRFSSKPAIFSFTGSWGFYYYGYRFYDPLNQRWLNRDPIEEAGGRNLYGFVGNGPSHRADPLGLSDHNRPPVRIVLPPQGQPTVVYGPPRAEPTCYHGRGGPPAEVILAIAGIFLEPLDWIMTVGEIVDDPGNPWSYAGLVPFVPSAVGKVCKVAKAGPELLLDSNVVIGQGKQFVASGENVVKAAISDKEIASLVNQGRIKMPGAASQIPSVPNSLNVDLRINVRAQLTPKARGNFADGVIGATSIERGSTLITHDQALIDAVNALGGAARKPRKP